MASDNSLLTVCIPASIADPFYRYKRDRLHISVERKKGFQTRLENIDRIAHQLNVPAKHLIKTLSKAIGSRISGSVIAGKIEVSVLEKVLEDFIAREVLCSKCKLPELDTTRTCKACGHATIKKIRKKIRNKDEVKLSSSTANSEIDNLACKLIHHIDDLLACKPSHDTIIRLETLKAICWDASSLDALSSVEKALVEISSVKN
jgi:translation initiation factor 2 beta subunit (eIF-2beta)/eIF-5